MSTLGNQPPEFLGDNNSRASQDNDATSSPPKESLRAEARKLFFLAVPTIIIHLSFVVPPFLTASYIGRHFGHYHLTGYTLANLTGNLLTLALLQGFFNASDTLSPQAFGAGNYRQLGLLAMRGYVATMMIIIPTSIFLFLGMDKLLIALGQDPKAAQYAWDFYMIYALSFPFYSLYVVIWKFLSAQDILLPLVVCTSFSTLIVLPISLELLVKSSFGYWGAALAIVLFYVVESLAVLGWCCLYKPHHSETWPGLSAWKEALEWNAFSRYLSLGIGGMLASFEWIYWEVLGFIVGLLGVLPLSAHTIPTQVIFLTFMFPVGLGIALAIRLGTLLSQSVPMAKMLTVGSLCFSVVVFGLQSILLYQCQDWVFSIFTDETAVIDLCKQVWFHVCLYLFLLSMFGMNVGISIGLGLQWTLGVVTVACLWFLGLPMTYYFSIVQGGGFSAVWIWIWPPYILINICMGLAFITRDWNEIAYTIIIREGVEKGSQLLDSLALVESQDEKRNKGYGAINH